MDSASFRAEYLEGEDLMRKTTLAILAVFTLAAVVWAGDAWKKPISTWTDNDISAILQTSPWAKTGLRPVGAQHSADTTQASGSGGIAGSSSDLSHVSAGATTDKMGGSEKNASAAAANATYVVYWWSSRTIRAASMRRQVLKGTMTEADAEKAVAVSPDEYMILVQSTDMYIFQQRGEKAFESVAYLQAKKTKEKISPSHVAFLKGPDGVSVTGAVFYFPKKSANGEPTISADEKEIDFFIQVGGSKILTYFETKRMVDSQGQDL
jgi:hypothetical protein